MHPYVTLCTSPVFLLVTNNTNKAAVNNNDRYSLFAFCFNNDLFAQKYSQRSHSVQSLTQFALSELPYMTYCEVDFVTLFAVLNTVLSVRYAPLHSVL
jgi:hypothetical protein